MQIEQYIFVLNENSTPARSHNSRPDFGKSTFELILFNKSNNRSVFDLSRLAPRMKSMICISSSSSSLSLSLSLSLLVASDGGDSSE